MNSNASLLFILLIFLISCESNDPEIEVSVFTEEVAYSSGETVILTGRILSSVDVNVTDHGFHISTSEDFSSPITISLGERFVPGRFVGELNELDLRLGYFCRAFIIDNGIEKIGNVLEFSTLSPRLVDFAPKEGSKNNKLIIEGVNIASDAFILWNGQKITPNSIEVETFIEVTVPAPVGLPYAVLQVVSQGDTLLLEDRFEYIIGQWDDGGMIVDTNKNINHIYFEDLDYFYYGLGVNREFNGLSPRIYRLDKNTLERDILEHSGFPTESSFYTPNGYFGGGALSKVNEFDPTILNNSQFFKLDGAATKKLTDIPALLFMAVAYAHEDYVYVYGGEDQGRNRNTNIYRYDIANDTWENIGDSPYSPLNEYPYFSIGSTNYFVTESSQLYGHDLSSNTWEVLNPYPEEVKKDGINVVIDGTAFVGLQNISRKVFEYIPEENRWERKNSNPNLDPSFTLGFWVNDNKITIMRTDTDEGFERFFWTFDPYFF